MKKVFKGIGSGAVSVANFGLDCADRYLAAEKEDKCKHALAAETLLESSRRVRGKEHPYTLEVQRDLAATLDQLGRYQEAANLMAQVVAAKRTSLGSDHPDTVACLQALDTYTSKLWTGEEAVALGALVVGGWLGWKLLKAVARVFRRE